ncbi:MAG: glycosyltransferase family 4 protein [Desulfobacterales bacterium]|nr:glycosyltransferase family 4 protein [Desulfobacterales bacterium]
MAVKALMVEGWRFVPHSYAVVNQFQLLALRQVPGIDLTHRDLPFYGPHWRPVAGLLPEASEAALRKIPGPSLRQTAQVTYRIGYPYDLSTSRAERTFAFGTSELLSVTEAMLAKPGTLARQMAESETVIITPSRWSKEGFVRGGAPADRVVVVPHGVDPAIYHPLDETGRSALRQKLGWDPYFIFLSVGTMKGNKGLRLMLKALAALADRYPQVRLVLKGGDAMYDSSRLVTEMAETLTEREKQTVLDRIFYLGEPLSFSAMAQLFQAADAYVSPYLAEGFNLPVLEAAACGLPVICTRGGATDDFAHPRYFLGIDSRLQKKCVSETETNFFLVPDLDHLTAQMVRIIQADDFRRQARQMLPGWVHGRFSWTTVARQLLDVFFPGS